MDNQPSTSNELIELNSIGVNVWGEHQEVLEKQALEELTTFHNNLKNQTDKSNNIDITNSITPAQSTNAVDISQYLKRQEELKKRQDNLRALQSQDKNKLIADQINNRHAALKASKKQPKRKLQGDKSTSLNVSQSVVQSVEDKSNNTDSGSEYVPSEPDSDYEPSSNKTPKKSRINSIKHSVEKSCTKYEKVTDDGDLKCYQERLSKYYANKDTEKPEVDTTIAKGFKTTSRIWESLYGYQKDGVRWLWTIHEKVAGGLLGDEMGLGKTVQIIAFLYSLNYSQSISSYRRFTGLGPTLIVCPSTVIHQWVKHFHEWAPEFRVSLLHQSGSFTGNKHKLIKETIQNNCILVTTYRSMLKYKSILTDQHWHYIILDEGHKIRNPTAQISEAVKEFKTPHRLLLTGSPMQNNLQELWSLFDFVNPRLLGTLDIFMQHFAIPIMHGGYTNATPMQESLALSMATALKTMITPHFLRRAKSEVIQEIQLPNKSEQVLFCSITPEQQDLYKGYLMSEHVNNILGRSTKNWFSESSMRVNILMSITALRKICNHPDIYLNDIDDDEELDAERFGHHKRSGKMVVVAALLKLWKKQQHRVLLFTQSVAMISIFERFLHANEYTYLKMHGATNVASRQPLIEKFNNDKSIDVFLLTTKVGGLGINLTGADRVIIYDPDWNPATDTQARERAWRIGQQKDVTIYRLLSAGTIEEKMYQRQIWKQLLSNKVLNDPTTQKFFKSSDLHDLFSFQEYVDSGPETTNIFKNSRISLESKLKTKKKKVNNDVDVQFTKDKVEKMRQLASQIAKNISTVSPNKSEDQQQIIDPFQIELREEREHKLKERKLLKKLSAPELLQYNREKAKVTDQEGNQLDDCDTDVNFAKALLISEKSGDLYKDAKRNMKNADSATDRYRSLTKIFSKSKKHNTLGNVDIDTSGNIEGEQIEGLLKRQTKKKDESGSFSLESQDQYVLSKLFSRKGVQSALEHDNVLKGTSSSPASLQVRSEAQWRTDNAMEALQRSRIRMN